MTPTPLRQPSPRPLRPHRGIRTSRRRNRRAGGLVAAALAVVVVGSGCAALTGDTGADEVDQFLAALTRGDVAAAAALTTDPAAAEETIIASVEGMGLPGSSAATTGDDGRPDRDPVTVEITWDMGTAGGDRDEPADAGTRSVTTRG